MNAPIDLSNVVLHTERLTLRPWRQEDLEDFFAYASVDGVGQMAGWKPHESKEESQAILDRFIAGKKTFALELDGRAVGSLGVEEYNEERFPEFADKKCREIGYVLAKDCWGRGLMPEAVREVIRHLFEDAGLDLITCGYYVWNRQSKRVQEKCGFTQYATGSHKNKLGNVEQDVKNILTRENWLAAMLTPLEPEEFDRYVDFAYYLALDTTKSGYPTYTDGVKTREDFVERARKAFSRDNEEILLFRHGGRVAGWIHWYILPEDRYIDTCSFCIAEGMRTAIEAFVAFVRRRFPGNDLFLGFPKENVEATAALEALGFELIEESYNNVLDFASYQPLPEPADVVPITRENYGLFAALHEAETDMYWNTARILAALDGWRVLVALRDGEAAGAIYHRVWDDDLSMDEIFGVDFPGDYDSEVFRELMAAVLNAEKRRGVEHMVFFDDDTTHADTLACGFRCVGQYVCFRKTIEADGGAS